MTGTLEKSDWKKERSLRAAAEDSDQFSAQGQHWSWLRQALCAWEGSVFGRVSRERKKQGLRALRPVISLLLFVKGCQYTGPSWDLLASFCFPRTPMVHSKNHMVISIVVVFSSGDKFPPIEEFGGDSWIVGAGWCSFMYPAPVQSSAQGSWRGHTCWF